MELIPAIDLRGGNCVRLLRGERHAETFYSSDPLAVLARYRDLGAARVHVVDLDGAFSGDAGNAPAVEKLAGAGSCELQVGGGLRDLPRVRALLALGVRRAVIGSVAVTAPEQVMAWADAVGPDALVLALDVRLDAGGVPRLSTHGWTHDSPTPLWQAVERYAGAGLRHVLCTDIGRDGALSGPNTALYGEAVRRFPEIAWQASGGVAAAADLHALRACGVAAAISGKALLEDLMAPQELAPFMPHASASVRERPSPLEP